ncbi:MAG: hypothetical protein V5B40_06125 [Candidatus Accumulibacter meliphilus]|jgi:hypothetical protein|uniref:hypothetical protein n=1 Tax=Candidatus Accumulibacter meliphilus TaxID=2211374 RepID=UPI002FC30B01
MSQQRITDALATAFSSHSIVFWHDADGEFSFSVKNLLPDAVELLYLDDLPALAIKLQLERAAPLASFLLYSAKPVPDLATTGCWTSGCAARASTPTTRRSCWRISA